ALVFALAGHDVLLHDRSGDALDRALARLRGVLDKGVARGTYAREAAEAALVRIATVTSLDALRDCTIMTEAVYEALDAKADVLRALDRICAPSCIFASNTSTLPISTLAAFL
ncbi:3-hydroxyacyl-CoA dehydrogenase family protein, partial [Blastomonas sp.]